MIRLIENENWKKLFKPEDTSWLQMLKKKGVQSLKSRKTALLDIVTELADSKIIEMRAEHYSLFEDVFEKMGDNVEHESPRLIRHNNTLHIVDNEGYNYCCDELENIDSLTFKRLGGGNGLEAYVIYIYDGMFTKIELIAEHENAA